VKVIAAAKTFRHLSKGNASYEIAQIVNLDPGTVRRYLSKLYPGELWKS
jgi:DNA-binding CsgD family transcriptional regulator